MSLCGNRLPISGECLLGCGGFGGCKQGHEDSIKPRSNLFNPLTGEPYKREPVSTEVSSHFPDMQW